MKRAAQAPLQEQGFLAPGPGCFRTLGLWRAVRLEGIALCHRVPPLVPSLGILGKAVSCCHAAECSASFGGGAGP